MSAQNLRYDISSLNPDSGELRLIGVKRIGAEIGTVFLSPNERRVEAGCRGEAWWNWVGMVR